jgi:hypothetical protein
MASTGLYVAVVATTVAGIAIGALVVVVLRPADPHPPPPPPQGPPEVFQQHAQPWSWPPPPRMQGMPMQAMSRPASHMGGPGHGQHGMRDAPPAYVPYGPQPAVSGRPLPMAQELEADQTQQLRRRFEAEFENTVPSMEDLVRVREENQAADLDVSPSDVLEMLSAGNVRFWTGQAARPELNAMQRRAEIWQSYPKVAIIGCSDSRVPIEIVFDLALGDVFSIRVAGARRVQLRRTLSTDPFFFFLLRSAGPRAPDALSRPGKVACAFRRIGPRRERPPVLLAFR